jgi:drug/metabolite transporter (DMT)-like permease
LELAVVVATLSSAFLHAAWNAWVKSRPAPDQALAALIIGAGASNSIVLIFTGLPAPPAWGFIAVTVMLSIAGLNLLGAAYREGDFAVAYPMVRGLVPIVLVLLAVPLFGEEPTPAGSLGVLCVSAGLGLVAWESARRARTMTLKGLGLAALAACVTAASVVTDARGARLGGDPLLAYAATVGALNALVMAIVYAARGQNVPAMLRRQWRVAIVGPLVSMASYFLFIWSVTRAPVAMVAAMRETSMVFALVIAAFALRERIGPWRVGAVVMMLIGVALIRL